MIALRWCAFTLVFWCLLYFSLGFIVGYNTAHAAEQATFGSCMAAAAIAGAHNYKWQNRDFTAQDCAFLANKMDRAYNNGLTPKSTLSDAPATKLPHEPQTRTIMIQPPIPQPNLCCIPEPEYQEDEFFHQLD